MIQLPADLFFGTSIATCILVLKKSKKENTILFIDASKEFVRSGNKNTLSPENRKKILEVFANREEREYFSKIIEAEQIQNNDYNIAVSSYVEAEDTREKIDITELNKNIAEIVARQSVLRKSIDEIVAELEGK